MKFFINSEKARNGRIKARFYNYALLLPDVLYTSFFYCIRVGIMIKKNSSEKQREQILKDQLFWQTLGQIKRVRKITFLNLNKDLSQKRLKNLSIFDRFLNLFFKDGLRLKYLNYFNKSIQQIYHTLYFFWKTLTFAQYVYIDSLFSSEKHNYDIFSALIYEMTVLLEPMFQMRVEKVNKQFKKVIKKRFTSKIIYVKPNKRLHLAMKAIILYLNLFKPHKINERFYHSLFKTLVEQKQSYLYKRKIYLYNRLIKQGRVKQISIK